MWKLGEITVFFAVPVLTLMPDYGKRKVFYQ